jgi:hypothetical protein
MRSRPSLAEWLKFLALLQGFLSIGQGSLHLQIHSLRWHKPCELYRNSTVDNGQQGIKATIPLL